MNLSGVRSKAAPPNERRPLFSCGSVRRGLSCNKPKVGLYFGVFEDTVAAVGGGDGAGGHICSAAERPFSRAIV